MIMIGKKMTMRDIASLALKLTGVYTLVRYLGYLPMVLGPLTMVRFEGSQAASSWLYAALAVVPPTLYLALCILIVIKSDSIAARLAPADVDLELIISVSRKDVFNIAFCCVGLIVLVDGIPQLINTVTNFALALFSRNQYSQSSFWISACARLASNIFQVIIGLALFLQPRGLVGLWHKLGSDRYNQES